MKTISVKCFATTCSQVDHIMDSLNEAGFSDDEIAVVYPQEPDSDQKENSKAPDGIGVGAAMGAVIGGLLGVLANFKVISIPGADPFVTAGPWAAAFSFAFIGAAFAGILGGFIGLAVPDSAMDGRAEKISLSVQTGNAGDVAEIKKVLRDEGAKNIKVSGETLHLHHSEPQYAGH